MKNSSKTVYKKNEDVVLYLDMDGVFSNFIEGAGIVYEHFHNITGLYPDELKSIKHKSFQSELARDIINTPNFWLNLNWVNGGQQLFNFIHDNFIHDNICILTAPLQADINRCKKQKYQWIKQKFNNIIKKDQFFVDELKWNYVNKIHGKYQILIDDRQKNITNWINNGGIGILHDSANYTKTIDFLKCFLHTQS